MNLDDYTGLKAAVETWLIRPDLTAQIPTFIHMAEVNINRVLRTKEMIERSRLVASDRYVPLPAGWVKAWNIQRTNDNYPLQYLSPFEIDKERHGLQDNPAGLGTNGPVYYSLFGETLELLPAPTTEDPVDIEMLFYRRIPSLSDNAPTNWLLKIHPDAYLYGALVHSAPFLKEDERVAVWENLYQSAVAAANQEDTDARRSGAPMSQPNRSL